MSETAPNELDASTVALGDWPMMIAPRTAGLRQGGFQTIIKRGVLDQIHEHGRDNDKVEICGVLVGNVYTDSLGPYLYITAMIKGDAASSHAAQVTFTAETWQHIQDVMDKQHPGEKIVGWYHTHPGFDIFLSGMDLFIQDNFFNLPWQVAFVYDPIGEKEGLFVWRRGKSEKEPYLVEEDATVASVATQVLPHPSNLGRGPITRYSPMLYLTGFIIAFLAMYVFLVTSSPSSQMKMAPVQPSPGLRDETTKEPDFDEMLNQMNVDPADKVKEAALFE
jgi:proteasome lid subunit RPN8/RPN11